MTNLRTSIVPMALAIMFVLASCGKEPLVCPAKSDDAAAPGTVKSLAVPVEVRSPERKGNTRSTMTPDGTEEDEDEGISDDGDDLSDTERNRKKK